MGRKGRRSSARPGLRGDRRGIAIPGLLGLGTLVGLMIVSVAAVSLFSFAVTKMGRESFALKETMIYAPRLRGLPLADQSCFGPSTGDSSILRMEQEAGKMYDRMQKVALGLMVGVLFFIGFAFMIEKFAFLQEGTAERLIRESIFILILLFIAPLLYNLFASGINTLTVHGVMGAENMREASGKVDTILNRATTISFIPGMKVGPVNLDPTQAIGWFFFGGFTFMAVFGANLLVIFKLFFTLVAAALLPLVLVFRLYPPFQRFSGILVDALIGLVLATVLVGGIVELAQYGWSEGFGGWIFNVGILLACGTVMTLFAPGLGGVVSHASRSVAGAVGGAIGGAIARVASGVGVAGPVGAVSTVAALGTGATARAVGTGYLRAAGGAMFGAPDLGKSLMLGAQQYSATLERRADEVIKEVGGGQWTALENTMKGMGIGLGSLQAKAKKLNASEVDRLWSVKEDARRVMGGRISPDERVARFLAGAERVTGKIPEDVKRMLAFDPKYEPFRREVMAIQDRRLKEIREKYPKVIDFLSTPSKEFEGVVKKRGLPKNMGNFLSDLARAGLLEEKSRKALKELNDSLMHRRV